MVKINNETKQSLINDSQSGLSISELMHKYGISKATFYRIVNKNSNTKSDTKSIQSNNETEEHEVVNDEVVNDEVPNEVISNKESEHEQQK